MSQPEARWTSTAGSATIFGPREKLSRKSRLNAFTGAVVKTAGTTVIAGGIFCGPTGLVTGSLACP